MDSNNRLLSAIENMTEQQKYEMLKELERNESMFASNTNESNILEPIIDTIGNCLVNIFKLIFK